MNLCELTTVKTVLGVWDSGDDSELERLIGTAGDLFDRFCNRSFERAATAVQEFRGDETEISVARYPIESVSKFELKTDETTGWVEVTGGVCLIRRACVLELPAALGGAAQQARVTYAGGYVLPGSTPTVGQTSLPKDVENAAIEQVVFWYRNRNTSGLSSVSGDGASIGYEGKSVVTPLPLLPLVQGSLEPYRRILLG